MTLRFKLTIAVIVALVVANSLLAVVNVVSLQRTWQQEVQTRVRLDLNSARAAYNNHIELLSRSLATAALDRELATDLSQRRDNNIIAPWVARFYGAAGMDFIVLLDADGRALCSGRNPQRHGDSLAQNPLVAQAIRQGKPVSGTILLTLDEVRKEGPDLADRVRVASSPTPATGPSPPIEPRGMVVAVAAPIFDEKGRCVGLLYGGDLLNRRHKLVDSIKREVFSAETYDGKPIGTVTIFQNDVRIATNVIGSDGRRAVGTRMSDVVAREVLQAGRTWASPALVVDDWYITAYEPIRDPQQQIIGTPY